MCVCMFIYIYIYIYAYININTLIDNLFDTYIKNPIKKLMSAYIYIHILAWDF